MEQHTKPLVDGAHVGVEQPQPRHGAHIRRHHVGEHEQGAEELFPVQVRPPHQPGQREGQQGAQDHGSEGGDQGVGQGVQVEGIGVQPLKGFQGECALREERFDDHIHQRHQLEQKQKVHDQQNDDPFHIHDPALVPHHEQGEQQRVQGDHDAHQHGGAAVADDELPQPGNFAAGDHAESVQLLDFIAHTFFQGVYRIARVRGVKAGQQQLHQHGLALLALQVGSLCRRRGQGGAFIGDAVQHSLLERGQIRVGQCGDFFFLRGAHLGAVHQIRRGKQLVGQRGAFIFRRGSEDGFHVLDAAGSGALPRGVHQRADSRVRLRPLSVREAGQPGPQLVFPGGMHVLAQAVNRAVSGFGAEPRGIVCPLALHPHHDDHNAQRENKRQTKLGHQGRATLPRQRFLRRSRVFHPHAPLCVKESQIYPNGGSRKRLPPRNANKLDYLVVTISVQAVLMASRFW